MTDFWDGFLFGMAYVLILTILRAVGELGLERYTRRRSTMTPAERQREHLR